MVMLLCTTFLSAQTFNQYFDGADTNVYNAIFVELDTSSTNIWQIGPPQKMIFDAAASVPNVIVTDTINGYPINNTSSFIFKSNPDYWVQWGVLAIQWKQKLDYDHDQDGGIVEYSLDYGATWENAFNNPYVYNFYGFDQSNMDTLNTGDYAFSGTDAQWKDIWMCFDFSFLTLTDTVYFKFTHYSDSIDNAQVNREGWMIDNLKAHITGSHTIAETKQEEYLSVFPTITQGKVNIVAQKLMEFHIIEHIEVINVTGQVVQRYGKCPTKFWIDLSDQETGLYYVRITTNKKTEAFPVFLDRSKP